MTTVLRARREAMGISVRTMAGRLSCTPTHLSDIERGNRNPGRYLLPVLLDAYGLSEDEAFYRVAVRYELRPKESQP